jgi:drug/metabolite transporter (DMT)-like permease
MTRRAPVVALCLAAVSFGSATTGTKYALGGFDPVSLLAVELVLATVALWGCVAVRGFLRPRSLARALVLGLFEPALAYLGQTAGLSRTSATNGALIMGLECVFVVVLAALLLREPINGAVGVAIALAVAGLVVLESGDRLVGPGAGDALVLFGSLSAAAYTIVARGLSPTDDPLSVTTVQFSAATALTLPAAVVAWTSRAERVPLHVEPRFLVVAALVGIVGFAGSFVLYNFAIATVEAAPAAVIINLIPAVGLGTAVALLGEPLTMYAVVGALLICASVAIFATLEALADRPADVEVDVEVAQWSVPAPWPDLAISLDLRVLVDDIELPELSRSAAVAG